MIFAEVDPIVRMFRLQPASGAAIRWLLILTSTVLVGIALGLAIGRLRERRRRREAEEAVLRGTIERATLEPTEREAFERLVEASGAPALACATSIGCFDRGVESLLSRNLGDLERVDYLRALRKLRVKLGLHAAQPDSPIASTRILPPNLPLQVAPVGDLRLDGPVDGMLLSVSEESLTVRLAGPPDLASRTFRDVPEVEVTFLRHFDAAYAFRSRVLDRRELAAAFLVLGHPRTVARVQKRGFVRVTVGEEIAFSRMPELASPGPRMPEIAGNRGAGLAVSLSGGGLRLRTEVPLERGELLHLELPFLPEAVVRELAFARVVRSDGTGGFGLRFEGISPRLQAAIIQYVRFRERRDRSIHLEAGAEEPVQCR
jgi:c-di-GMP-binding flagellar brake protein YcgR